jgi:peptidoglycan/xylan/chitin deacetylase (PgdA/CDA1 family)
MMNGKLTRLGWVGALAKKEGLGQLLAGRKTIAIQNERGVVSFTFDDFPRSAHRIAGQILEGVNARGTFYLSMGLMNTHGMLGAYFTDQDLRELATDGHELACHTYSHLRCRGVSWLRLWKDIHRNQARLRKILPGRVLSNFSYPYGDSTPWTRRLFGSRFRSCRGTTGGINQGRVDLSCLKANRLYSQSISLNSVEELMDQNARQRGWLIFYTHDVSTTPSAWGCTPQFLEAAINYSARLGAEILNVGQFLAEVKSQS